MAGEMAGTPVQEAPAQPAAQGPQDAGQAMEMVGLGLEALIQNAPSPEVGAQLQQIQQQLMQVVAGASQLAPGTVSPEQGGAPGAVPVG